MNKLRIHERMCTTCGVYVCKYLHWCQKHLYGTCINAQDTCLVHATLTRKDAHTSMQAHPCDGAATSLHYSMIIVNYLKSWNFFPSFGKQETLTELNHDDALAEPNVQRRACWFNTQTDCAASAPHPLFSLVCLLTVPLCSAQEINKIHDRSWRCRGYVVA